MRKWVESGWSSWGWFEKFHQKISEGREDSPPDRHWSREPEKGKTVLTCLVQESKKDLVKMLCRPVQPSAPSVASYPSLRLIDSLWPALWWKSHPFVFSHRCRIWAKFDGCGWTCHTWVLSFCCVKWRQKKRSGWEDCDFYLWSAKKKKKCCSALCGRGSGELLRNKNRLIR